MSGEHLIEESFSGADKFVRKYFLISHSPIRDAKGETLGVVVISNDISQHKIIEEELKTNQLKTLIINEKLHVVGGLTRHDVGNKLMTIKANVYLLNKRIGDDPEFAKYLERINSALDGADEIIEFSRTYEKIGLEQRLNINVENCFNEAAALFPELSVIRIVNECQGLTVLADSLLRQLFYNLIDNSLKHGEKVTQIRLNYKKDVDGVELFYEDDGFGIPEENKSKIFSGGFTTSNSSGLGLRLIKKMLEVYS